MALFGKMNISAPKNLLVVLPNPMGDAILAGPALRRLRTSLPDSRIAYLAVSAVAAVLGDNPWNDDWLEYVGSDTQNSPSGVVDYIRSHNFDAVILLPNSFRAALWAYRAGIKIRIGYRRDGRGLLLTHPVSPIRLPGRFAPMSMFTYYDYLVNHAIGFFGLTPAEKDNRLELFTNEMNRSQIDELLIHKQIGSDEKLIILVPGGTFGPSKHWPVERFAQLADKLIAQHKYRVIVSCAPGEAEIARKITSAAQNPLWDLSQENLSLGGLKELIRRCELMVANDTGPCHIAAAFDVPLVTIFGPTDPRWTATGYDREIRLRVDVPCGPCQQKVCPLGHHNCMKIINIEDVYAAARQLLSSDNLSLTINNGYKKSIYGSWYLPYEENFVPLADGNGLMHSDYRELLVKNKISTCAEIFTSQKGQKLDKPGLGSRERIKLELTDEKNQQVTLYLKRYHNPSRAELFKRLLRRRSRAGAGCFDFAAALQLAEKGIPVARPIAYGQEGNWLGEKRSFAISEELPGADALERLLPRWEQAKQDYQLLRDKKALIKEIALLVRRLHEGDFYHRDLYLSHIFLSRDSRGRERLCLIDLQRVFRPLICKRRWRIKDLAQLYYSSRDYFWGSDVIRFLRYYLQTERLSPKDKGLARAAYRKAQRIARHDAKRKRRFEQ